MTMEYSLLYEVSEISQRADMDTIRDSDFSKHRVDRRLKLSRTPQLRASIGRQVAQLSFVDFSADTNSRNLKQNTLAGNQDLEQGRSWRYTVNSGYRLF